MIQDVRGRALDTPKGKIRVLSLVPSDTYSVFALGAGADLLGRTQFCVHPKAPLEDIPSIGGTKTPKLDKILALKPDLILANREENRKEDIEALEAAGCRVFVSQPKVVRDSPAHLRDLGKLLNKQAKAKALAEEIDAEILRAEAADITPLPALYFIWRGPYMGVGRDTYIYSCLSLMGFKALAPPEALRYPELTDAFIESSGAQAALFPSEPFVFKARHVEAFRAQFPQLPAVQAGALPLIPGEDASWHGAWALRGLAALRALRAKIEPNITP